MDKSKEALIIARNLIKVGLVNSINSNKGTVNVLFPDKDNIVSNDLPMLSFEYHMPKIGDQVLCLFLGNGLEQGFCLGSFYSQVNSPPSTDESIYRKQFDDGTYVEYDITSKALQVVTTSTITIKGNIRVEGNIEATGSVIASNIGS